MFSRIDFREPLLGFAADPGPGIQDDSEKNKAGIVVAAGVACISQTDK